MCMFCAAVPVAAAVGANLNTKQRAKRQAAESENQAVKPDKPIARLTLVAIALLTLASITYHTVLSPLFKI